MGRRAGFGFLILLVGVGYLLQQIGLLHLTLAWLTWPVIWPWLFVLLGLSGLNRFRRRLIPWGSLFFIVLGVLLSLRAAHFLPHWLQGISGWGLFWSMVLIFAGLSFITPRRWGRAWWPVRIEYGSKRKKWIAEDDDVIDVDGSWQGEASWHQAKEKKGFKGRDRHDTKWRRDRRSWRADHRWIGDLSIGRQPWVLRNLDLWNGIGDIRVNLATAHVEDGQYLVEIGGLIADVRVLVPENLPVLVETEVGIGDINVFGEEHSGTKQSARIEDAAYELASRKCHIIIRLQIGDVEVVRV